MMSSHDLGRLALALSLSAGAFVSGASAESRVEKEMILKPGGILLVDTDAGSVDVRGSSRDGVRVVVSSSRDEIAADYALSFTATDGRAEIVCRRKSSGASGIFSWFSRMQRGSLRFEIEVPTETAVTIDTAGGSISIESIDGETRADTSGGAIEIVGVRGGVFADTSGGSIRVSRIEGDVLADTSGGPISIERVRGKVSADTSGGSIQLGEIGGDIVADTSGGSIRISGAQGRVRAETSGGSIDVSFAAGNSLGGALSTSGGGVRVAVDPAANLEIDAEASGGSVHTALELKTSGEAARGRLRGRLGSGGERLQLRASGGGIQIEGL